MIVDFKNRDAGFKVRIIDLATGEKVEHRFITYADDQQGYYLCCPLDPAMSKLSSGPHLKIVNGQFASQRVDRPIRIEPADAMTEAFFKLKAEHPDWK